MYKVFISTPLTFKKSRRNPKFWRFSKKIVFFQNPPTSVEKTRKKVKFFWDLEDLPNNFDKKKYSNLRMDFFSKPDVIFLKLSNFVIYLMTNPSYLMTRNFILRKNFKKF